MILNKVSPVQSWLNIWILMYNIRKHKLKNRMKHWNTLVITWPNANLLTDFSIKYKKSEFNYRGKVKKTANMRRACIAGSTTRSRNFENFFNITRGLFVRKNEIRRPLYTYLDLNWQTFEWNVHHRKKWMSDYKWFIIWSPKFSEQMPNYCMLCFRERISASISENIIL